MSKKNILLLSHTFMPYPSAEAYLMAKSIGNTKSLNVDVLTMQAFNFNGKTDQNFAKCYASFFKNVTYIKPPNWYNKLPFHRLDSLFSLPDMYMYLDLLYLKHLQKIQKYDAVMTWSMYHSIHLLGLYVKYKYPNIPWVAHFSDPWTTNPFFNKNIFVTSINKYLERRVFQKVDILSFTSQETIDKAFATYPSKIKAKARVIPHAYDDKCYTSKDIPKSQQFLIRYVGSFYGQRQPTPLLEALKILAKTHPEITNTLRIEFIGSSPVKENHNLGFIYFVDQVDYITSLHLMKEADLLLIIDAPFENSPFLPSKLIDYIGANKPIFGITPPGSSQKLIEQMGFLTAHPNDIHGIAAKLLSIIQGIAAGNYINVPSEVRNKYCAHVIGKQLEDTLLGAIDSKRI